MHCIIGMNLLRYNLVLILGLKWRNFNNKFDNSLKTNRGIKAKIGQY
jgi:hypothetical protein